RGDGRGDGTEDAPAQSLQLPGGEPARSALTRCRNLGMAAADDAACRKAWAENRRRFFGSENRERPPAPNPERFGETRPADPAPARNDDLPPAIPDTSRLWPGAAAGSDSAIEEEPDGE
ncbi:putative entry exclusion protein TrbK-alt, partial [Rhizobiaceae sp. 2RAB30]